MGKVLLGLFAAAILAFAAGCVSGASEAPMRTEPSAKGFPSPEPASVPTVAPQPAVASEQTVTASPVPEPTATPGSITTPTPDSTATLEPTSEPTATPIPVPESQPKPVAVYEPVSVDYSLCHPTDSKEEGVFYISPAIGVKRRIFPEQNSQYAGAAAQNTEVAAECKRSTEDGFWYRVRDSKGSFWTREEWVAVEPVQTVQLVPPDSSVSPPPVYRGGGLVTLSFDDSSSPERANAILDVLAQKGVQAVFCVNGNWARANPEIISRMRAEGHALCNHTASHKDLTTLSDAEIRTEIAGGSFLEDGGRLRPPYGAYDSRVRSIAASMGYYLYMWSIDTRDWTGRSADAIVSEVVNNLHLGAIVLMHLHGANTLEALPAVIDAILDAGYTIGY